MTIYNWFVNWLMPLFIDNFGENVIFSFDKFCILDVHVFNAIFSVVVSWVLIYFFIILPFKFIKKILKSN